MADKKIFCNTPWFEIHIYWDGSLGICCQEAHKLYGHEEKYNISNTSMSEWFNSPPVRKFRQQILSNNPVSACTKCYDHESAEGNSRRIKGNQKSVIFQQAFQASFDQSPHRVFFDPTGTTITHPVDLHIDLGNYCNLACKMCRAQASSTIAVQEVKWGIKSSQQFLGTDWTRDTKTWNSFLEQLLKIPNLVNIHFMGGETLITGKFEELVDFMIAHQRFDLCFSFVTNGTIFKPELMNKLKKFRRVGIEVSIETTDAHNAYQRQGTNTTQVLDNIEKYQLWCNGSNITTTIRPAISALTIGYFPTLLQYCLDKKLIVKSLLVTKPRFLDARILPGPIKQQYLKYYQTFLDQLQHIKIPVDYNASDPHNHAEVIKEQAQMCMNVLSTPTPSDSEQQLSEMVNHCRKWDHVYGYSARNLYPELEEILDRHGY